MGRFVTAAEIEKSFNQRYKSPGVIAQIAAGKGTVETVDAAAAKGYAASGKLQWVRATEHFYVKGEIIETGQYVQVQAIDAKRIVAAGRAEMVSEDEVKAASAPDAAKTKK